MAKVFFGLGSNIGDKKQNLHKALDLLKEKCVIKKVSSFYKSAPMYYEDQDWFVNAAAEVDTHLSPQELMSFLEKTEKKMGRVRHMKNGPRLIDLDILFYDDLITEAKEHTIPHPKLRERSFVLVPLAEIAPEFIDPLTKKTIEELLMELGDPVLEKLT